MTAYSYHAALVGRNRTAQSAARSTPGGERQAWPFK
jgi:hypothetical protein